QHWDDLLLEALETPVQRVDRHLDGVESHSVRTGDLEHVKVDVRALVPGEADEADLAGLAGRLHRLPRSTRGEDPLWIIEADDLVKLHQIDVVGPEPPEGLVDLLGGGGLGASVDLRHQERALAVSVLERVPHAALALAAVVVPAIVQKGDSAID